MVLSLIRHKVALVALLILGFFIILALLAPWVAPHPPDNIALRERLTPPAGFGGDARYPLGTDSLGRDILSRVIYGGRTSLTVGFSAMLVSGCLGTLLGLLSGYYRHLVDHVLSRVMDIQLAFPSIVLAIAAVAFLGPGLQNVIIVLGIAGWVTYGRVVRAETLSLREREFVQAARAIGSGTA